MTLQTGLANSATSQSSLCTTASHAPKAARYSILTLTLVVFGLHVQSRCLGEQQSLGGRATVMVRPAMFCLLLLTVSKTLYLLSLTSTSAHSVLHLFKQ